MSDDSELVSYRHAFRPAGEYEPGVPRFLPVLLGPKTYERPAPIEFKSRRFKQRRRFAPEFTATFRDNGDGTVTVGEWTVPKRIREREVASAGKFGAEYEKQRVRVRCSCGREEEIGLPAWKFALGHGTDTCRRCARKRNANSGSVLGGRPGC